MSGRATFGELLQVARERILHAAAILGLPHSDLDLLDVTRGMHSLAVVMGGYLQDVSDGRLTWPSSERVAPSPWAEASRQARRAAANAVRYLEQPASARPSPPAAVTERGECLREATRALAAGRDLLHSHVATGSRVRQPSRCAPVIFSLAGRHAIAAEIGELARQVAALGTSMITIAAAGWEETSQIRRDMSTACECLRVLYSAVDAARQCEPVPADVREFLLTTQLNMTPPRRVPEGSEDVAALCDGVIGAADRLRQSARQAASRPSWSPDINAQSLRQAAAASVAATHNCGVILRTVGSRSREARGEDLLSAAEVVDRSRDWWLHVARTMDRITSDVPGRVACDAADAGDLALWTGRLAYDNPQWTLASGPHQPVRSADNLVATRGDVAKVVAAVHHASDAMVALVGAHQQQARSAARTGRLLVPTRSLPDRYDIPHPYGPAPPDLVGLILTVYRQARSASSDALASLVEAAATTRAPSRVLAILAGAPYHGESQGVRARAQPGHDLARTASYETDLPAGPFERTLQGMGVADAGMLSRSAAVDRVGEQLIVEAIAQQESLRPELVEAAAFGRSRSDDCALERTDRAMSNEQIRSNPSRDAPDREP